MFFKFLAYQSTGTRYLVVRYGITVYKSHYATPRDDRTVVHVERWYLRKWP